MGNPHPTYRTPLALLLLLLLHAAAFSPADNYLLSFVGGGGEGGRTFLPSSLSPSFSFPLSSPGLHLLRLHFTTTTAINATLSSFPLFTLFTPNTHFEFFVSPRIPTLTLSLSPLSSLASIELFSAPPNLLPYDGSLSIDPPLSARVLETLLRVNVGGPLLTSQNDTLWRSWLPDSPYLDHSSLGIGVSFDGRITYPRSGATPETAPHFIYATARAMAIGNSSSSDRFNISWTFPVANSDYGYLVRMHFCDVVSSSLNELYFNVYINGYLVYKDLDLSSMQFSLATAYYVDFLAGSSNVGHIQVSVGPSERSLAWKKNAILNGLEIMKINGVAAFSVEERRHIGVVIGSALGSIVSVCVLVWCYLIVIQCQRQRRVRSRLWLPLPVLSGISSRGATELTVGSNPNLGLRIPFSEIQLATKSFDEDSQIGSGGFGKVFKGTLRDGTMIAAKRSIRGSKQGLPEFQAEIVTLSKIRHRHLVSLIGYCEEQSEMILVYEYMNKGPLQDHLYGSDHHPRLSWKQRLDIAIGAARGLHYLHTGCAEGIIHRDIKSSNILLDEDYTAKVADFGLSRSAGPRVDQARVSTGVKGSFGYLDPEYFKTQQLTDKSDVYSFGVVLLEILCARLAIDHSLAWEQVNLAEWAMQCQKKGSLDRIVDPLLKGKINSKSLRRFGETVEKCLAQYGVDRPTMGDVLWNLEYVLQLQETC